MSRKNKGIGSAEHGCPDGWRRTTIIVPERFHEAMKMIAWYDRMKVQDIYAYAIYDYINKQKDRAELIRKTYDEEHTKLEY